MPLVAEAIPKQATGARNFPGAMDNTQRAHRAVAAVVTTYHPDLQTLEAQFARLDGQIDSLLVIDNGSADSQQVAELVARYPSARFIGATENRGLGWAHNKGLRLALDEGADAVLLLDQDSLPSEDMVRVLYGALTQQREQGAQTAAVGARYLGVDQGHPSYFVQFGRLHFRRCFCSGSSAGRLIRADMLISSGTLFAREALESVGLMEEGLFIDHLDTEWFLRAGARGWQSFGVCDALMDHGLGDRTIRVWLGRWRYLPVHKPFRYYYVYRNSLLLWRRNYPSRRWKHTDMLRLAKMFFVFAFFTGQRLNNLAMMFRGIRDGLSGKTGPLRQDLLP